MIIGRKTRNFNDSIISGPKYQERYYVHICLLHFNYITKCFMGVAILQHITTLGCNADELYECNYWTYPRWIQQWNKFSFYIVIIIIGLCLLISNILPTFYRQLLIISYLMTSYCMHIYCILFRFISVFTYILYIFVFDFKLW